MKTFTVTLLNGNKQSVEAFTFAEAQNFIVFSNMGNAVAAFRSDSVASVLMAEERLETPTTTLAAYDSEDMPIIVGDIVRLKNGGSQPFKVGHVASSDSVQVEWEQDGKFCFQTLDSVSLVKVEPFRSDLDDVPRQPGRTNA